MKKEYSDFQINKIGLFKIFSNLDTQSAIVAAIVISAITFFMAKFIDLCNYIYWRAYFTEFKIPMAYFEEAIIHEDGMKYVVLLCIPLIVIFWLVLGAFKKGVGHVYAKIKKIPLFKHNEYNCIHINKCLRVILFVISFAFFLLFFIFGLTFFIRLEELLCTIIFVESAIFIFWNYCKKSIGQKFTFSPKNYYFVRIIGIIVMIYIVLGNMYCVGSFQNYSANANQTLKMVNDEIDYYKLKGEEVKAQLVLLETADYYYVTDVMVKCREQISGPGSPLNVQVMNDDSYRFIEKVDCPIKSVDARLTYIRGRYRNIDTVRIFAYYFFVSVALIATFVLLLSIPMNEKITEEKSASRLQVHSSIKS